MLPDTLGILEPNEVKHFLQLIIPRYPHCHFDFHGHNDYDLGTANVLEAIKAGAHGIHLTINGMGERAGNAPLSSAVAVLHDFLPNVKTGVAEKSLYQVSKLVETFSGFRVPVNKPVVGENVFTQTAGIHADGDKKIIYTTTICCQSDLDASENMRWERPVANPILKTISLNWVLNFLKPT